MTTADKMALLVTKFIADHGGTAGALEAIRETPAAPTRQGRRARRLLIKYVLVLHKLEQKRKGVRS